MTAIPIIQTIHPYEQMATFIPNINMPFPIIGNYLNGGIYNYPQLNTSWINYPNNPNQITSLQFFDSSSQFFWKQQYKMPKWQMPDFNFPKFSFDFKDLFINKNQTNQTGLQNINSGNNKKEISESKFEPTGKRDLAYWKSQGYDEEMGKKLAKDAVARCPYKWNGQCVGYTRKSINAVYNTNFENAGAGCNFGHKILDSNELKGKFKCFKINGIKSNEIPDGSVLIWPPSAFNKGAAAKYGHGAIAYNGKPYSDNVGCDTMKCNEIWIPVKA